MTTNYDRLPEHMRDGARLYIEQGIAPGGFLTAVLCNDLAGAASRADGVNQRYLFDWAQWLYNEIPSEAWGSEDTVNTWMKKRREERAAARR